MPQMMPMYWMMLFTLSLTTLLFTLISTFFNFKQSIKINKIQKKKKTYMNKIKWY